MAISNLGEILRRAGKITDEQLAEAIGIQRETRKPLATILAENGWAEATDISQALAQRMNVEYVDLSDDPQIDMQAVDRVPESMCRKHVLVPLSYSGAQLIVAFADPTDVVALDDVRALTGMDIKVVVSPANQIIEVVERFAAASEDVNDLTAEIGADDDDIDDLTALRQVVEEAPVVKFCNMIITDAVRERASDIHVEPAEDGLHVRYRVDGVLHHKMTQPRSIIPGVTSRLKIMAELDIAERRIPQDGRISLSMGGNPVDLRVSTLPTVYGEKVVMRILDKSSILLSLDDLGFLPHNFETYAKSYNKPYGCILVTGPTGSGKSTTLYATLNVLNKPEVNIVTTEDPVEYQLKGINQVQVNKKAGLTFAAALRSILRQDPDIVLVGEMRDRETANIGIEAALTGHLVLSTLHTNDAPSAVTRLTEMGVEPFLVGTALDCVLAQRLARRLCGECKEQYEPDRQILVDAGFPAKIADRSPKLWRQVGCKKCGGTGYRGRLALHEVMAVSEGIQRLCVKHASSDDVRDQAIKEGMKTLRQDGLAKCMQGHTTLEEVSRVVV